jgi:PAS domain S-box-containing protein
VTSTIWENAVTIQNYAIPSPDRLGMAPAVSDGSAMFRSFFERSGMCMAEADHRLRVQRVNKEFCREFGRTAAEVRGTSILDFIHRSGHPRLRQQLARVTEGRRSRISERVLGLRSGSEVFPGRLVAIAVEDDSRHEPGLVMVVNPEADAATQDVVVDGKRVLTELDARILSGIAAGASTVQLASKLYLSRQGVEYRVGIMLRKLRVPNRAALVSRAYAMGVLSVGVWPPQVLPDFVE